MNRECSRFKPFLERSDMKLPSYRRHSSGQGRVTLAGKDYLLGPHGSAESKRKYNKLVAEFLAGGQSQSFGVKPAELTLTELLAAYNKHLKKYYGMGPESEFHRFRPVRRGLKSLYGPEPAISYGPLQYKATRAHLMLPTVVKRNDGTDWVRTRSRNYVNNLMKKVKRLFRWASAEGMLPSTIYDSLKTVDPLKMGRTTARESEPVKPISPEAVSATIKHLPQVVADMVRLQSLLGCRPGEVCKITPAMVDRSNDVWEIHLAKHKSAWRGKSRTIYCGPKAQSILASYLLRGANDHCFGPQEATKQRQEAKHAARTTAMSCGHTPGSHVVKKPKNPPGKFYVTMSYARAISYTCKQAGIEVWGPNRLRHSLATSVRKSDGLEAAAVILGHSEIGVTQVYAEQDRAKAIEVVRRIG